MSACYSDIAGAYGTYHAEGVLNPFAARVATEPVLTSLFQWLLGALSELTYPLLRALPVAVAPAAWYFALTAAALGIVWIVTLRLLLDLVRNRTWDLVLVAASPLLIVYVFHGWDVLSVAALVAALHALRRRRPLAAGAWVGVGAACQVWPALLLVALAMLAGRGGDAMPGSFVRRIAGAAGITWVVLNLPVVVFYPQAWWDSYRALLGREAGWATLYHLLGEVLGVPFPPIVLSVLVPGLWLVGVLIIGHRVRSATRPARLAEVLFLLVAMTVLVSRSWLPQYALWLLVPAVLAIPRWRWLLGWMLLELLVFPATMLYSGAEAANGLPLWLFALVVLVRGGVLTTLVAMVVQQIGGRREDAVYAAEGGVDPLLPWCGEAARVGVR
nr:MULTISPECIES: glycosyltransferase 87 family protein [unclassified Corynebacterium]